MLFNAEQQGRDATKGPQNTVCKGANVKQKNRKYERPGQNIKNMQNKTIQKCDAPHLVQLTSENRFGILSHLSTPTLPEMTVAQSHLFRIAI